MKRTTRSAFLGTTILTILLAAACSGAPEHLPGGKEASEAARATGEDLGKALARPITRSEIERARGDLEAAQRALEQYSADESSYPQAASCAELAGGLGPFGRNLRISGTDPWGGTYECRSWGEGYALRSAGPDGASMSPDDIVVEGGAPL